MRRGRGRRRNEENDEDEKQSSCFLRFDGLEGDVWSGSLKGCFSIRSFQYGQGRGVGGRGRGGKREVSEPSVSECTIMMNYSSRVNLLHGLCTAGAVFPTAQVFIRPEDGEVATTITMKDVIISGFSTSVGGSGVMDVSVSLNYTDLSFDCTSVRRKPIVIPKGVVTAGAEQQPLAPIARDGFYALFSKLSPADLLSAALSCKQWLQYASDSRLLLKESSSFEYHPYANTVVNGYRMPYTKPERNNRYGGSEDEDNKEKDEEPKIFGADPPSNVDLGFAMHLVFPKADE